MAPSVDTAISFITAAIFKRTLVLPAVKRYLNWCDSNWTIAEFNIPAKLQQLNLMNKLEELHQNSVYYNDLTILAECRTTLATGTPAGKVVDTGKKVAISFINSCLVSNSINKVCAVYRSGVLTNLYSYIDEKWGLQHMVL